MSENNFGEEFDFSSLLSQIDADEVGTAPAPVATVQPAPQSVTSEIDSALAEVFKGETTVIPPAVVEIMKEEVKQIVETAGVAGVDEIVEEVSHVAEISGDLPKLTPTIRPEHEHPPAGLLSPFPPGAGLLEAMAMNVGRVADILNIMRQQNETIIRLLRGDEDAYEPPQREQAARVSVNETSTSAGPPPEQPRRRGRPRKNSS